MTTWSPTCATVPPPPWLPSNPGGLFPPLAQLVLSGTISERGPLVHAFLAIDRGAFIDAVAGEEDQRYANMPYRNGIQHLSAPGIYGAALEELQLAPELSFLNVCSGTGYLSAVVSQVLGPRAVHHAVELSPELAASAASKLKALPKCGGVEVTCGSCLGIDAARSMRFDRIYVGAGADEAGAPAAPPPRPCEGPLTRPPSSPPPSASHPGSRGQVLLNARGGRTPRGPLLERPRRAATSLRQPPRRDLIRRARDHAGERRGTHNSSHAQRTPPPLPPCPPLPSGAVHATHRAAARRQRPPGAASSAAHRARGAVLEL